MIIKSEYNTFLRNDFATFIERSFYELNPQTTLKMADYIEVMASKLEACRQGKIKRLIINLPPRYLKSHCASIAFVAWCLGHNPASQIICVSYGQDLADKLARDTRNVMLSTWYKDLFHTRLSADKKAVNDFMTTATGFRMATSVGGVLTGRGADIIIIDDPLKPDEAMSETQRQRLIEWYENTLLSRLNNKSTGCIILIMQRLHQDDLVGHVLGQEQWEVVNFPAIAEEDYSFLVESPLGNRVVHRKKGEALHPERESVAVLEAMRAHMGTYNFSSQYQQNPIPVGGAMVKTDWLKYYVPGQEPGPFHYIFQSWDTANKAGELNDYSVCTVWGVHDKNFYLLEVLRKRLNYPELKRAVIDMANRYSGKGTVRVVIEDKASGTQLIQELQSAGQLYGLMPYEPPSGTDKVMRLHAQTDLFENGFVHLPETAPWLDEYLKELTSFPGSKYDDQVDSTAQAMAVMRDFTSGLGLWERLYDNADGEFFPGFRYLTPSDFWSPQ